MLQTIGLIIGGYVLTRYLEMAKGCSWGWGIWLAFMFLGTAGGVLGLLFTQTPTVNPIP